VLERVTEARERLLKANPNEIRHQQQLAFVLKSRAKCYINLGKPAQARPLAQRTLEILERTAAANPERHDVQVELAQGYCTLGDIDCADGQPERARGHYEQALAIHEKRAKADPGDGPSVADVADALRRIGTTLMAAGRPADAIVHYHRSIAALEGLKSQRAMDLYDVACCHSLISAAAARPGSGLTADEAESEAVRAVAGVRRAIEAGYANVAWIRTGDPDLQPIRSRPDFRELMMDLAMPSRPFANPR
jgi:tetratricopeptide (TPR) repeat protein